MKRPKIARARHDNRVKPKVTRTICTIAIFPCDFSVWLFWIKTPLQESLMPNLQERGVPSFASSSISHWKLLFLAIITAEECRPTIAVFQTWPTAFFPWHWCSKIRIVSLSHMLHSADVIRGYIFFPTSTPCFWEVSLTAEFWLGSTKPCLGRQRQSLWLLSCVQKLLKPQKPFTIHELFNADHKRDTW